MKKSKILVTGSSGFLGKNILAFLKSRGHTVLPFDLSNGNDLLDENHLKKSLKKVEFVCHLAAVGDVYLAEKNPKLAALVGVGGCANLVHVANQLSNIKKVVYASTWEVYGHPQYQPIDEKHPCNPDHPYSISKYGGELMIRSKLNNVPWVILRLGSAYGRYMRENAVIPLFINKALSGEILEISGNGSQTRQFTHAVDIARAFEKTITNSVKNDVFNIVASQTQSIAQIAEMVKDRIGVKIKFGPQRTADVESARVSNRKANKVLGWKPEMSFEEGFGDLLSSLGN